jgi:phosphatidylinositol 4-kinase type 2
MISSLIPNLGYISEAAAFLLDQRLGLNIVPYTGIVHLSSPTFYYTKSHRLQALNSPEIGLPEKKGSFQAFVKGYTDANKFFAEYPWPEEEQSTDKSTPDSETASASESVEVIEEFRWTEEVKEQFREEFEKLVVLDYLIRNTGMFDAQNVWK